MMVVNTCILIVLEVVPEAVFGAVLVVLVLLILAVVVGNTGRVVAVHDYMYLAIKWFRQCRRKLQCCYHMY